MLKNKKTEGVSIMQVIIFTPSQTFQDLAQLRAFFIICHCEPLLFVIPATAGISFVSLLKIPFNKSKIYSENGGKNGGG